MIMLIVVPIEILASNSNDAPIEGSTEVEEAVILEENNATYGIETVAQEETEQFTTDSIPTGLE